MLSPDEQTPEHALRALRPLLDQLYFALERAAASVDTWFRDGDHAIDPYFRAMFVRYLVREHLTKWRSALHIEDIDDAVEVGRPSNVGLHVTWRDYQVRIRMGDDRSVPVPSTKAATTFFNQPLIGLDVPLLRLFVLWTMTESGVVLHLACPHSGELGRKESLRVAWAAPVPHPVEIVLPDVEIPEPQEDDVPWFRDDVDARETGEEPTT